MNSNHNRTGLSGVLAKTIVAYVSLLLLVTSCTTTSQGGQPTGADRVMAENSQMKKRIPLIERENDVLTKENFKYKSKLHQATDRIEKLSGELTTLIETFEMYRVSTEEQIQLLEDNYSFLESASLQKFGELSDLYNTLETEWQLAVNENTAHRLEIADLRRTTAEKETALANQAGEFKRTLKAREAEIASAKKSHDELLTKIEALSNQLAEVQWQRNQIESDLQSARAINTELLQRLQKVTSGLTLNSHLK